MDSEYGLSRKFDKYGMPLWQTISEMGYGKAHIMRIPKNVKSEIAEALKSDELFDQTIKKYLPVLKKKITTLGHDHPDTCNMRNVVAYLFLKRKLYEKAFMLHYQIKSAFSDRMYLILEIYYEGEYGKALRFTQRIYDHMKKISYGFDPLGLKIKTLTGHIYSAMNKYKEALKIYDDVYRLYYHDQGEEHPEALSVQRRIAVVLRNKGNYNDAMEAFKDVLIRRRKTLGDEHEDTLVSRKDIAELLVEFGSYDRALQIYMEVYEIENKLRHEHPTTLETKCAVARILSIKYKFDEAIKQLREVFEVQNANRKYYEVRATMKHVALVLTRQEEYREALGIFIKLYEAQNAFTPLDVFDLEKNVAILLLKLSEYDDALDISLCLYVKLCDFLSSEHSKTLEIQSHIGSILSEKGEHDKALKVLKSAYEIQSREDYLGPDHPNTLRTKLQMADVHFRQNNYTEALDICFHVLQKMLLVFKNDHAEVLCIQCEIAKIHRQQNLVNLSFQSYYQVYETRARVLGETHPDTISVEAIMDSMSKDLIPSNLHKAADNNDLKNLEVFVITESDLDVRDIDGSTALHLASEKGYTSIIKCLLKNGAIYNLKDRKKKRPEDLALNEAVMSIFKNVETAFRSIERADYKKFVSLIEKEPSVINARDVEGCTLLHWASSLGRKKFVAFLLEAGAHYQFVTNNGNTPLHLAISKSNTDSAEELLKYIKQHNDISLKSFVNAKTDTLGTTCLHIAAQNDCPYSTQLLLDYGADTKIKNKFGKIPMDLTSHYQIRMALLDRSFRIFNPFNL